MMFVIPDCLTPPPINIPAAIAVPSIAPAKPAPTITITPAPPQVIIVKPAPTRVITRTVPVPNAGSDVVSATEAASQHREARAVVSLLTDYFNSINERDHQLYRQTLTRAMYNVEPAKWTVAGFIDAFGQTTDSNIRLREIGTAADGRLTATVTFISRQADSQTCTHWTITRYLRTEDSRLRIDTNPGNPTRHFAC